MKTRNYTKFEFIDVKPHGNNKKIYKLKIGDVMFYEKGKAGVIARFLPSRWITIQISGMCCVKITKKMKKKKLNKK